MEMRYSRRDLSPVARDMYARLKETGQLSVSRCEDCGRRSYPPRDLCYACGSDRYALEPHSGDGEVYAFTTQERAFRFVAPDVIGLVELDGGVGRGFGVIHGAYDELAIGRRVRLEPVTVEENWVLPAWRPA